MCLSSLTMTFSDQNPMGRPTTSCACGCGQLGTRLYRLGHRPIKGYPTKTEPGTDRTQRIHVLRAEKALGRPLPRSAEVHHMDGSKSADAPLAICPDKAYHRLIHVRMRVADAGGDPNTQRICGTCKELVLIPDMVSHKGSPTTTCKSCLRRISKERGYGRISRNTGSAA